MSRMRAIAFTGLLALACGPVDDWLFPLWVPTDVLVADVDGDGRADVVALAELSTSMSHSEGRLVVYRQTTPGIFAPPESYVVGVYPWKLAIGDVDGDGLPDLLAADVRSRAVWLLQQNALDRGRFLGPRAIVSGPGSPQEVAIADLDGDGSPEIAVAMTLSTGLLLHHDPAHPGTFAPATDLGLPRSPSNVKAADIDGDGRADLFASAYLPETDMAPNVELAVVLQRADGTLGPPTALAPQHGLNVYRVAVADYDDDGRNDLFAFFSPSKDGFDFKLTVLLQGPQPGTFSTPIDTSLAGIAGREDAVVADLDGDGRADVAVAGGSRLNLFRQSGKGAFSLAGVYEVPISVSRVAAGDIDGDGLNDLVVLGGDNQVMLLRQSSISHGTFEAPRRLP